MGTLTADFRYALRMLWKNRGFTFVAVAALALGIGANTAIFTVVNSVLLQPLPYPEPDRIVQLARKFPQGTGDSISIPKYMAWRDNHVFDAMALYGQSAPGMNLGSGDRPEQIKVLSVSEGFFRVFGAAPATGRTFTPDEDLPGGPKLVVLSYAVWQKRFAGDPSVVGRQVELNGQSYNVLGILSKGFASDPPADAWIPLGADPNSTNQGHYLTAAARLKPGVSIEAARAEMKIAGDRFRQANPKWMDKTEGVAVRPLQEAVVGNIRPALLVLLGAVAFVLLIACANVANLLLARAAVRQREMAVRAAIGASRGRVVRQLLTESVLLAGIGGAAGFALGSWGVRVLLLFVPGNIPRLTDPDRLTAAIPALDWRVAAFTFGVAVLTGVLFGVFPALQVSSPDLASMLKEGSGRSGTGRRQNRARSLLVVTEVALALVLLVGATLLIRTFIGLNSVNPGIDPHNVLTLETSLAGSSYTTTAKVDNLITQVVRRVEGLPGVEAAAAMVKLPAVNGGIDLPFTIAGKPPSKGDTYNGDEQYRYVTAHYFTVFRIPLVRGRIFDQRDTGNSAPVVVINQAMAKRYWPKEDPIGSVMNIGHGLGPEFEDTPRQVVGVVGTVRETGVADGEQPVMYLPQAQVPQGLTALANGVLPMVWAVRSAMDPAGLRTPVEREFRSVDALLTVSHVRPMTAALAESTARQSFNMLLLTIFAAIAMLLAAIGIYGLMAYSVEQRTQEIGIRMALGATPREMLRLIMGQGMKLATLGVVAGLAIAFGVTRLLAGLLFGVKPSDPVTYAAVAVLLAGVALLATYLPARRAARTMPTEALRYQ